MEITQIEKLKKTTNSDKWNLIAPKSKKTYHPVNQDLVTIGRTAVNIRKVAAEKLGLVRDKAWGGLSVVNGRLTLIVTTMPDSKLYKAGNPGNSDSFRWAYAAKHREILSTFEGEYEIGQIERDGNYKLATLIRK